MRVHVESYGCTMNHGEGRAIELALSEMGHEVVDESRSEAAVLNTCAVIGTTERRMLRRLSELESQGKPVLLTGCLAKVGPERVREVSDVPMLPPCEYDGLDAMARSLFGSGPPRPGPAFGLTHILPISQGCLGSCTYCVTRLARGRLSSYDMDDLVEQTSRAVEGGAREILVTSQDLASYGLDIGTDLVALIEALLGVPGDLRLRLGMMNPDRLVPIADRLLDVMGDRRVYDFLHLPVQSGSDEVLKRMGRRYTSTGYMRLIASIRERVPGMTLSTDVITGFPGETPTDHIATVDLIRGMRPDIVNVTRFSARPGTAAAEMPLQIHGRDSKARSRELTDLRFAIGAERNAEWVGSRVAVLVNERGRDDTVIARTGCYRPVVIDAPLAIGTSLDVEIVDSTPTHLVAEPIRGDSFISESILDDRSPVV